MSVEPARGGRLDSLLLHVLMLLVVLAPLPLGSNREWSWSLCALLLAGLAVLFALRECWRPTLSPSATDWWPMVLFLLVLAWAWLQAAPWTPKAWWHPVWTMSGLTAIGQPGGSISLAPDDTHIAVMRLASYGLVFAMAFLSARDSQRARRGLQWLVLAGVAYAVYGLAVFGAGSGKVLWLQNPGWVRDVRGTFINHNSFATWTGLSLLCALALLHQSASLRRNPAYRLPLAPGAQLEQFLLRCWRPLAAVVLLTAALVLSHSRGGFISFCAGGLVLLVLIQWRRPVGKGAPRAALWLAIGSALLVFGLTSGVMLKRIDRLTADTASRLDAYQLTLQGIGDNPWLGFGYGTFAEGMRLYRDERIEGFFDKAHNTYLENAMELGWPAALGLMICVLLLALGCWRGLRQDNRHWIYPATGLAATVLVGVHATVDFSLQIPAVAIAYAAILGTACAQARSR